MQDHKISMSIASNIQNTTLPRLQDMDEDIVIPGHSPLWLHGTPPLPVPYETTFTPALQLTLASPFEDYGRKNNVYFKSVLPHI